MADSTMPGCTCPDGPQSLLDLARSGGRLALEGLQHDVETAGPAVLAVARQLIPDTMCPFCFRAVLVSLASLVSGALVDDYSRALAVQRLRETLLHLSTDAELL